MAKEIKVYKKLLTVELKDGTVLFSDKSLDELVKYMESCKDVCVIDGVAFNRYEFKKAREKKADDLDDFILSKETSVQRELRAIVKERDSKGLRTNGPTHLWQIYEDRFLQPKKFDNYTPER